MGEGRTVLRVRLDSDELYPYYFLVPEDDRSGREYEVPDLLWENYEAARKAFIDQWLLLLESLES